MPTEENYGINISGDGQLILESSTYGATTYKIGNGHLSKIKPGAGVWEYVDHFDKDKLGSNCLVSTNGHYVFDFYNYQFHYQV